MTKAKGTEIGGGVVKQLCSDTDPRIPGHTTGSKVGKQGPGISFPRVHLSMTQPTRSTSPPLGILSEASQPPPHQSYRVLTKTPLISEDEDILPLRPPAAGGGGLGPDPELRR